GPSGRSAGLRQLGAAGLTLGFVEPAPGFQAAYDLAEQVAAALGADEAGQLLVDQLRTDIEAKAAEVAAIAPQDESKKLRMLFLYLRGDSGIYYLFGSESRSEEHTSELQSRENLVCRLLL